jgi:hypothetical protein
MTRRRQATQVRRDQAFKGRQFTAELILWAVRWYLMFPISYRDLELMLLDRGVEVDHTTIFRWIQAYAAAQGEPAHHRRGQERGQSKSHCGDEEGWRALAPLTAATGVIPEQYRRARPSERETADSRWTGLRWLLDGPTNTGRLRGDGNDAEGASSEHRPQRHPDPGNVHRCAISSRRLRDELGTLADDPRHNPKRCNRTRRIAGIVSKLNPRRRMIPRSRLSGLRSEGLSA